MSEEEKLRLLSYLNCVSEETIEKTERVREQRINEKIVILMDKIRDRRCDGVNGLEMLIGEQKTKRRNRN